MKNRIRPLFLAMIVTMAAAALLGCQSAARARVAAEIEAESATTGISPLGDLGSARTLEILPLIDEARSGLPMALR